MNEDKTVDTVDAEPQGVTAAEAPSSIDYEAELARIREERDNYKKGMLLAKSKLKAKSEPVVDEEEEGEEDFQTRVERAVQATLAATRNEDLNKREQELLNRLIRENKELKTAQLNRSQLSPNASIGMGGKSADTEPEVQTTFWSQEQLEYFKKRGIDPNKVKENLVK